MRITNAARESLAALVSTVILLSLFRIQSAALSPSNIPRRPVVESQVRTLAKSLNSARRLGTVTLTEPPREGGQLDRLAADGSYPWPAPPPKPLRAPNVAISAAGVPILPLEPLADASTSFGRPSLPSRGAQTLDRPADVSSAPPAGLDAHPVATVPVMPSAELLRALVGLANHSTTRCPLEIMTLLRPPYSTPEHPHASLTNVHSRGMAADIAAYGGSRIDRSDPEGCVRMTLALLRDLPPGRYRLGLPKAPETPAVVGKPLLVPEAAAILDLLVPPLPPVAPRNLLPYRGAHRRQASPPELMPARESALIYSLVTGLYVGREPKAWPFFPQQVFAMENGRVAADEKDGKPAVDGAGKPKPRVLLYLNEDYAPLNAVSDCRVRSAITNARSRGVDVWALFPDAADHVHLDVKRPSTHQ